MNVSVILCTYNGGLFVKEQLLSIINQTYPVSEIVIYDDASTDHTVSLIEEAALNNPVIKLFVNDKNIGFTKNFEQALKTAKEDVIAISDQDDIWVETKIEKMISAWKKECPVIYCASVVFSSAIPISPKPHPAFRRFEGNDPRKIFLYNSVSGHAMMIKKTLLHLIFPFADNVMCDWWIAVVAAYNGGIQYYPEVLVLQRKHENNVTMDSGEKNAAQKATNLFKHTLINHLKKFETAPNIPITHKKFLNTFYTLITESLKKYFCLSLFQFIFKNRLLLFNYKKRKKSFFSYIKNSYLVAVKNN